MNEKQALTHDESHSHSHVHASRGARFAPRWRSLKTVAWRSASAHSAIRQGFSLVELLGAIAIIGILGALSLAAMLSAQEQARASKTRSTITRLNSQIIERWEALQTRRLPVDCMLGLNPSDPSSSRVAAMRQLLARRRLMRMELPDKWVDVAWNVAPYNDTAKYNLTAAPAQNSRGTDETAFEVVIPWKTTEPERVFAAEYTPSNTINVPQPRTALSGAYLAYFNARVARITEELQGAECLYMIITTAMTDEENARERFHPSEVGDVDGDGAPEFIDGWGNPIDFIRWPAGFVSDLQPLEIFDTNPAASSPTLTKIKANLALGFDPFYELTPKLLADHKPEAHDPFDPMRIDPIAFRLTPLIYSAGPDGTSVFRSSRGGAGGRINSVIGGLENRFPLAITDLKNEDLNDPYDRFNQPDDDLSAAWQNENAAADLGSGTGTGIGRMRGAPLPYLLPGATLPASRLKWTYTHRDNIHNHNLNRQ